MTQLSFNKRMLILSGFFSIVIVNILNIKYAAYTIYFAIPASLLIIYFIFKVFNEKKNSHKNSWLFVLIACIINLVVGYILFKSHM